MFMAFNAINDKDGLLGPIKIVSKPEPDIVLKYLQFFDVFFYSIKGHLVHFRGSFHCHFHSLIKVLNDQDLQQSTREQEVYR